MKAGGTPLRDLTCVAVTAESGFQGETLEAGNFFINHRQHELARLDGSRFGSKGRKAGCDEVCVDECLAGGFVAEEFFGKSSFSRAVWAGNDDDSRWG